MESRTHRVDPLTVIILIIIGIKRQVTRRVLGREAGQIPRVKCINRTIQSCCKNWIYPKEDNLWDIALTNKDGTQWSDNCGPPPTHLINVCELWPIHGQFEYLLGDPTRVIAGIRGIERGGYLTQLNVTLVHSPPYTSSSLQPLSRRLIAKEIRFSILLKRKYNPRLLLCQAPWWGCEGRSSSLVGASWKVEW